MPIHLRPAISAITIAATLVACKAAPPVQTEPISWSAGPVSIATGTSAHVIIHAKVADGWHVYAVSQPPGGPFATRVTVDSAGPLAMSGEIVATPPPVTQFDSTFSMNVSMHVHDFNLDVPVSLVRTGQDTAIVRVRYQVCNASLCMPPHTTPLTVHLNGASARAETGESGAGGFAFQRGFAKA